MLTLNINTDPRGRPERLEAAAEDITASDPDVVCLQEVAHPAGDPTVAAQLAQLCAMPVVAEVAHHPHPSGLSGVAILSRLPSVAAHTLDLPDDHTRRAVAVELRAPSGRRLVVATAHLAWGGHREPQRLAEAVLLDQWCAAMTEDGTVTVLTGDFNTLPDSATIRFLTGREGAGAVGTYWVDTWEMRGAGPGATSCPENPWVAQTAQFVNIADPSLIPPRREDYILVRGWAHGRPGSPLAATLAATSPSGSAHVVASDHYAVVADLWDPPLEA